MINPKSVNQTEPQPIRMLTPIGAILVIAMIVAAVTFLVSIDKLSGERAMVLYVAVAAYVLGAADVSLLVRRNRSNGR